MLDGILSIALLLLMIVGMGVGMLPIAREAKEEAKELFKK